MLGHLAFAFLCKDLLLFYKIDGKPLADSGISGGPAAAFVPPQRPMSSYKFAAGTCAQPDCSGNHLEEKLSWTVTKMLNIPTVVKTIVRIWTHSSSAASVIPQPVVLSSCAHFLQDVVAWNSWAPHEMLLASSSFSSGFHG